MFTNNIVSPGHTGEHLYVPSASRSIHSVEGELFTIIFELHIVVDLYLQPSFHDLFMHFDFANF